MRDCADLDTEVSVEHVDVTGTDSDGMERVREWRDDDTLLEAEPSALADKDAVRNVDTDMVRVSER